ncbi:MAG: glutamate-cysteine ligase family 2(GCS2) [halophilic archaeon J07HX64]|jgi:Glutamate-cysteine ligase family 2(GCS2).|nr:MAG: glutamate-cysteine ligase family 2(GCS2) [halophilic archaeon J07HX64]
MTGGTEPQQSRRTGTEAETELKRSIELEYWVIDSEGRLTEPGVLVDAAPGVEREFVKPLLEVKTAPCADTAQLREQLYDRLGRVLTAAGGEKKGLVPLGTPLDGSDIEDLDRERTRIQDRVIGDEFECVRRCAGTHIHFEQLPGNEIDQLNLLTAVDPALALVNSSPFFQGSRLAASSRSEVYRWRAYDNLPYQGQLWPYAEGTEEWATRLQRRYEEFVTEAVMMGFDRSEMEAQFSPESAVWTPVKLREEFSTVEWRSPDAALPGQVLRLSDQLADLVAQVEGTEVRVEGDTGRVTDDAVVLPEFEAVQGYVRTAVRTGLSSPSLRTYLDRMGFEVSAFEPLTREFDTDGDLSPERTRELRLTFADRLAEEVRTNRPVSAD